MDGFDLRMASYKNVVVVTKKNYFQINSDNRQYIDLGQPKGVGPWPSCSVPVWAN